MPRSEALKRAQAKYSKKYNAENVRRVSVPFYPNDMPLHEWLDEQPNKAGYIKQLIREDMNRRKGV